MPDEADEFCLPEEREALAEDAPEEREALAEDADEFCPSEEPEAPKEELLPAALPDSDKLASISSVERPSESLLDACPPASKSDKPASRSSVDCSFPEDAVESEEAEGTEAEPSSCC